MKLTKQQLITVIKEELGAMLKENDVDVDPWAGYEQQMADLGTRIDTMSDIYDIFPIADWAAGGPAGLPSPSWEEAAEADHDRIMHAEREREYLENPPPWEHTAPSQHKYALRKAREAGETGWGPGSLEEAIEERLDGVLEQLSKKEAGPPMEIGGDLGSLQPEYRAAEKQRREKAAAKKAKKAAMKKAPAKKEVPPPKKKEAPAPKEKSSTIKGRADDAFAELDALEEIKLSFKKFL